MLKLLLVSNNIESFPEFGSALKENDTEMFCAESGETALKMVKDNAIDLVITDKEIGDMSGLAFAKRLISSSPMTNCVVTSSLPEKDFHEASEGLGILMQLPVAAGKKEADGLQLS